MKINCPRCGRTGKASAIFGALEQAPICQDCNSVLYNDPRLRPDDDKVKKILIRQLHILDKRAGDSNSHDYSSLTISTLFELVQKRREDLLPLAGLEFKGGSTRENSRTHHPVSMPPYISPPRPAEGKNEKLAT